MLSVGGVSSEGAAGEEGAFVGVPGARGGVLYLMGAFTLTTLRGVCFNSRKHASSFEHKKYVDSRKLEK